MTKRKKGLFVKEREKEIMNRKNEKERKRTVWKRKKREIMNRKREKKKDCLQKKYKKNRNFKGIGIREKKMNKYAQKKN